MSIKKKLILIFILFTSIAVIPSLSLLLKSIESQTVNSLKNQTKIYTNTFSKAVVNILMMNGGDLEASGVDIKDMISIFDPLKDYGLVYADALYLSSDEKTNGSIIASMIFNDTVNVSSLYSKKPDSQKVKNILYYDGSFRDFTSGADYFEFVKSGSIPGNPPFCVVRLVINKQTALKDVAKLKFIFTAAGAALIFIIVGLALVFGEYISRPIISLTEGAKKIESGNYNISLNINKKDEIGRLARTFNSMASMIEQKIMELEKANIELKHMDKLKDEFLASTSHELKTPIHGIIGLTESLLDGSAGEVDHKARHLLSMIAKSSRRLANLVNDILDYSKLKNSDLKLDIKNIDISSMAGAVITILSPIVSSRDIAIINEIPSGTVYVKGDENRIEQILINLIGNAIKFTEKGEIRINSRYGEDESVILSVTDTGIGIPEDKQEIIFDSFVQGDGSIARKYGGTGLGLAITKDLIQLHNGKIWVKSEPGKGSAFYFTLPRGEQTASVPFNYNNAEQTLIFTKDISVADTVTVQILEGSKVLVVDDEPINLQILINQLSREKYNVKYLSSGEDALAAIASGEEYDLVLLDVMMPVISGFEVCRKIREKYSPHELPVVLLTAKNTKDDILAGINLGANDYITKPFDRDELLARVKNYISLKKAVEEQKKYIAVKQELEIARNIQLAILPNRLPVMNGLSIKTKYEPMMEVGGDFYDFLQVDDRKIGVLIADVTGHGVPAALISSMVKIAFYMSRDRMTDPAALLAKINSSLFEHIYGRFITAFYMYIDLDEMKATFSNAAHWPIYIQNRNTSEVTEHTIKGRLIGIGRDQNYMNCEIKLNPGDRVILYTDGIIEERNSSGELLGEERLLSIIQQNPGTNPSRLIDEIFMTLYNWSGSFSKEGLEDDATMIIVDLD